MSGQETKLRPFENWEVSIALNKSPPKMAKKIEKKDEPEKDDSKIDKNNSDEKPNKDEKKDKDEKSDKNNKSDENDRVDAAAPAVRPPRKLSRPKITLKMPPMSPQIPQFYSTPGGMVTIPLTPASGLPPNCQIDVFQAYPNKAQEFMFRQFEEFKDFTKHTGKLGLSFGEKFAFWCYGKGKGLSTNSFTHICLLLLVFLYCLLGGIAFVFLENDARTEQLKEKESIDDQVMKNVTGEIYDYVIRHEGDFSPNQTSEKRPKSIGEILERIRKIRDHYHDSYDLNKVTDGWTLLNSMYFCGTVFTTIGYGHLAPVTTAGRVMTIVYAFFGIPLFLILLADYGKLLTRGIKLLWAYIRRVFYTGHCRKVRKTATVQMGIRGMQLVVDNVNKARKASNAKLDDEPVFPCPVSPTETPALSTYTIDDNFNLPISVAFTVLLLYIIGGALLFMFLEHWSLFNSFYFVFISTSTIGLGDMVPKDSIKVLLCSLVYFIFGLALTTMCINVVTDKLTDSFRAATAKIAATMGLELAEEAIDVDSNERQEDLPS